MGSQRRILFIGAPIFAIIHEDIIELRVVY